MNLRHQINKVVFIFGAILLLSSCVTYKQVRQEPEIQSILAITSKGDTIQVSTDYLRREFSENPGNYSNWRFNWNYNWYYGNGWFNYYDPYWMYRIPYQNRIIIQPRPKVSTPRYVPRHFDNRPNPPIRREPQVQPNRGRSNVQPQRTPQYNVPKREPQPQVRPQRSVPNRNLNNNQRLPIQN